MRLKPLPFCLSLCTFVCLFCSLRLMLCAHTRGMCVCVSAFFPGLLFSYSCLFVCLGFFVLQKWFEIIKGRRIGVGIVSRDFQAAMQAVEHGRTLAGASKELGVPR